MASFPFPAQRQDHGERYGLGSLIMPAAGVSPPSDLPPSTEEPLQMLIGLEGAHLSNMSIFEELSTFAPQCFDTEV